MKRKRIEIRLDEGQEKIIEKDLKEGRFAGWSAAARFYMNVGMKTLEKKDNNA